MLRRLTIDPATIFLAFWLAAVLIGGPRGLAAVVEIKVDSRETYVGAPVVLSVTIQDAQNPRPPALPQVPGAAVVRVPGTKSFTSTRIVNGRMSTSTSVTYEFRVSPQAPGTITIPSFDVEVDGETFTSDPIEIVVVESQTGDLLFVEVDADRDSVYLGEPLDATLRIWIKPYQDRQFRVRLTEDNMWRLVETELSAWGVFGEALQEMAAQRRRPRGREVLREDGQGSQRAYYRYDLSRRIWPEQAGPLDLGTIAVTVTYPVRLGRNRDRIFFRNDLTISEHRPVRAVAETPRVEVKAPPPEGRPTWFSGAVGRFDLEVTARPPEVAVGDPITITLTLTVRDGNSRLELLRPPPLDQLAELTDRFKVPSDPLAGTVEGRRKRFTQTIRPVDEEVREIPALPFSYFDPRREEYLTIWSDPIAISVRPASQLALTDVVGAPLAPAAGPTALTEVAGGLLANYTDQDLLLAQDRFEPSGWLLVALAAPPLLYFGTVLTHRRLDRLRHDSRYARRRSARRNALRRIDAARRSGSHEQAELIASAIGHYVADRCNLPAGAVTRAEVVHSLEERGEVGRELIGEVESLLSDCEQRQYAGGSEADGADLTRRASRCVQLLERERLS